MAVVTTNQVPPATMLRTMVVAPDVLLVEGVGAWGVGTPPPPDAMDGTMVVEDEALLPPEGMLPLDDMPGIGVGIMVLDGAPGTMVVKDGGVVTIVPLRPPPPPPPVVELLLPVCDGQHKDVKPPGVQAVLVSKDSKKRFACGQVKLTKGPDETTPLTLVTVEHI